MIQCLHTEKRTDRVSQCPQLTDYKSTSERWLTRRKTPFSLRTHLSLWLTPALSHSIFLWQHQIHTCPPSSCFLLLYFSLSPHALLLSSLTPIGCLCLCALGDYDNGDFVLGICVSLTCWEMTKKSKAQTQYVIGVETANTMLALLLGGALAYALHSIAERGLELWS